MDRSGTKLYAFRLHGGPVYLTFMAGAIILMAALSDAAARRFWFIAPMCDLQYGFVL